MAVVPPPAQGQPLPGLGFLARHRETLEQTAAQGHPAPGRPDAAGRRAVADGLHRWACQPGWPPLQGLTGLSFCGLSWTQSAAPRLWLLLWGASVSVAFLIV